MNQYEILIIGAGPGGYEAAIHAGKLGKKVAVVDCREAGGTCLNRGCIPTKTLLHSSELYHEIQNGAAIGVTAETVRADLPAMFARKNEVTAKLRAGIEALFKSAISCAAGARSSARTPSPSRTTRACRPIPPTPSSRPPAPFPPVRPSPAWTWRA